MANDISWYVEQSDPSYSKRREGIQNQINAINPQLEAAMADAQAAYDRGLGTLSQQRADYGLDARNSAAKRGLAWSNVADNYRANYDKNSFTPAMTSLNDALNSNRNQLNETYTNRRLSLEDTLNALTDEQYKYAMQQRQSDLDREASERQAAANRAAASRAYQWQGSQAATPQQNQASQVFYDDWDGNYTYDPDGRWDEASQTWFANGGEWKWDPSRGQWRLAAGDPNVIQQNAYSAVFRDVNNRNAR
jgi:hypothetical protein